MSGYILTRSLSDRLMAEWRSIGLKESGSAAIVASNRLMLSTRIVEVRTWEIAFSAYLLATLSAPGVARRSSRYPSTAWLLFNISCPRRSMKNANCFSFSAACVLSVKLMFPE